MIARVNDESLRRVDALGHPLERVLSALADPHLAEREPELLGQWALHVLGQLRDRTVEARPASTLTASRSSASGRSARIFSRRPFAFNETK